MLQECLIHWCFVRDQYDDRREALYKTFMTKVIKNKLANIVKSIHREKRKGFYESFSWEPSFETLADQGEKVSDSLEFDLRMDVQKVIRRLNPKQQEICRLLGEEKLSRLKLRKRLNMSQDALDSEIKRIEKIFEEAKLQEYIE